MPGLSDIAILPNAVADESGLPFPAFRFRFGPR